MVIPRRVAFLGLAALILVGAGIGAAATYKDDDDMPAALEQPATTTTSTVPAETTTTVAATSTTAPAPSATVAGATTTSTTRPTTTTRRAATTTTLGPAPCAAAQLEARVTTSKPAYAAGEQVRIHTTLHNRGATCTYPSFVLAAAILDPAGATVTTFDRVGETPGALGSGQAIEAFISWDRSELTPSGTYSVSVTWNVPGGPYTARQAFPLG